MRKFVKNIFYFSIPIFCFIGFYILLDPFKITSKYDHYYEADSRNYFILNKGFVSTSNFDNLNSKEQYNSFILGSSRSIFYEVADWQEMLGTEIKPYHFDASAETLLGIYKKVKYLNEHATALDEVLIIVDSKLLESVKSSSNYLFAIAPKLNGYQNLISFHYEHFLIFIKARFFVACMDFRISGKAKKYMFYPAIIDHRAMQYDLISNEMKYTEYEKIIEQGIFYTKEKLKLFPDRPVTQKYEPTMIGINQEKMLTEMKEIFDVRNSSVHLVINPLYDQLKISTKDLNLLKNLFGSEHVHDYSGINDVTEDYHNYYEKSHYRPHVARKIMKDIYQ